MAFYKGTLMPLIGVGACVSIQFGVVQYFKRMFAYQNERANPAIKELTGPQLYTAGVMGGVANSVLAGPIEQVRIRLQTQKGNAIRGPFDCLKQYVYTNTHNRIISHSGVSGVFRGMGPTVLREGHGMGIYFLTYEYLVQKKLDADNLTREQLPAFTSMLAGGAAGIVLWLMIYPVDVVKSYMQTDAMDPRQRRFRNSFDVVRHVLSHSGPRGFIKGLEPTLIRAPFANAATFVAFETAMRYLSKM